MSDSPSRFPLLDTLYQQYLEHENSAELIRVVSRWYNIGSISRLAQYGQPISRRAAVMVIGFLGNYSENEVMGKALCDSDRAVRMLADHGIRDIWGRQGTPEQQAGIQRLYQLVSRPREISKARSKIAVKRSIAIVFTFPQPSEWPIVAYSWAT